ncbi:uncharacterized protein LOC114716797 [Neltuma alba]|uniref:uncharacterized protein LOC114716797 n=1 Tax=Neltuma alba TaxID=207710 RepID=UPI0010A44E55|nr:uncharacterized protein LOC114716797 [Prosopis alba]
MQVMISNMSSPPHFAECYSSAPSSPPEFMTFIVISTPSSPSTMLHPLLLPSKKPNEGDDDFAFFVSQESDAASLTAEELFDGGMIKPFKGDMFPCLSKSPVVSNRDEKGADHVLSQKKNREPLEERRGRDRTPAGLLPSNSGRRGARSHSPYRVSQHTWGEEHEQRRPQHQHQGTREESSSSFKSSRKWKLRDFLLFRSASEGQGSSKDPLRKYSALYKKPEDARSSTDSPSGSSRRGPISPHEFHYAIKKAQSQDLKKKTFLPYKQGILGRLAGLGSHIG